MKASEMKKGDMFLFVPKGMARCYMEPDIFVKMHDDTIVVQGVEASRFIRNSALVATLISNYEPAIDDCWAISDRFFNGQVEEGVIRPIGDIREAEAIVAELGMELRKAD